MHPVAVVLGKHLGKRGFQLLGRLLGADRLLAARVGVDPGENVGQRNVLAFGEHRNLRKGAHLGIRRGIHAPSVEQRLDDHAAHGLRHEFIKSGLARNGQNFF